MILTRSKPIIQPRIFIPIYEDESEEKISHITGESIRVTNQYYMVDHIGKDVIISKVIFTWYGCNIIDCNNDEQIIFKEKYKYGNSKTKVYSEPDERRAIRNAAIFIKNMFNKRSEDNLQREF